MEEKRNRNANNLSQTAAFTSTGDRREKDDSDFKNPLERSLESICRDDEQLTTIRIIERLESGLV